MCEEMSDITKVFEFEDGSPVRAVTRDGEPWFVAKDVCNVLELGNVGEALRGMDEDERSQLATNIINPGVWWRGTLIITEAGLYSLVIRSRKPQAKQFKRWVTHEVLPSIRKHGAYMTPQTLAEALRDPKSVSTLLRALEEEQEKTAALAEGNEQFRFFMSIRRV